MFTLRASRRGLKRLGGLETLRTGGRDDVFSKVWRLEGLEAWMDRKIAIEVIGGGDWKIGGMG